MLNGKLVALTWKKLVLLGAKFARLACTFVDVTPGRIDLMHELRLGPVAQSELVLDMGVSPPVVSRMLKALEVLGLVTRTRDPDDARRKIVELTPKGRDLLQRVMEDTYRGKAEAPLQWMGETLLLKGYTKPMAMFDHHASPPSPDDRRNLIWCLQLAVRYNAFPAGFHPLWEGRDHIL